MGSREKSPAAVSSTEASIRTVEVLPPSKCDEGATVLLVAGLVLLCMVYTVAFERSWGSAVESGETSGGGLMSYQVLFRNLPGNEQRVFREMQEGSLEILRIHGDASTWPDVDALARGGVPPFAPDLLDKSGMRWRLRRSGLVSQYLGVPAAVDSEPAFMLMIQEPDPQTGEKAVAGVVDEEHQLLTDGRLLHVTYWKRPARPSAPDASLEPALRGWVQIRVRTPLEEVTQR
jgi:hypothetical protein